MEYTMAVSYEPLELCIWIWQCRQIIKVNTKNRTY